MKTKDIGSAFCACDFPRPPPGTFTPTRSFTLGSKPLLRGSCAQPSSGASAPAGHSHDTPLCCNGRPQSQWPETAPLSQFCGPQLRRSTRGSVGSLPGDSRVPNQGAGGAARLEAVPQKSEIEASAEPCIPKALGSCFLASSMCRWPQGFLGVWPRLSLFT